MQDLGVSSVPQWTAVDGWWFPVSVDVNCPHCTRAVNLRLTSPQHDPDRHTIAGSASCPGCGRQVHIWVVEPGRADDPAATNCGAIIMYPFQKQARQPVSGTHLLPQRISAPYQQALGVFNAGLWDVTASCCRQTLEGIARALLPSYEIQDTLSQNIRRLAGSIEFQRPIVDLAFVIREGSRLAAVLELTARPDEELARMMLDVTECLLQYVCTLPKLAADIKPRLERYRINLGDIRRAV